MFKYSLLLSLLVSSQLSFALDLKVQIDGIETLKGKLNLALYNSSESWLDIKQAVRNSTLEVTSKKLEISYKNLDPGDYAVAVFQDLNKDGSLNFQFLPPGPSEPVGFFGMKQLGFGPPAWSDAIFSLKSDLTININLIKP